MIYQIYQHHQKATFTSIFCSQNKKSEIRLGQGPIGEKEWTTSKTTAEVLELSTTTATAATATAAGINLINHRRAGRHHYHPMTTALSG